MYFHPDSDPCYNLWFLEIKVCKHNSKLSKCNTFRNNILFMLLTAVFGNRFSLFGVLTKL